MANEVTLTPIRQVHRDSTPAITARVTLAEARQALHRCCPVFWVTLDGDIRACNLLASWLCLEKGQPADALLGLNIYDLTTKAIKGGRLPVYFNQSFIAKKEAVLARRIHKRHRRGQAFTQVLADARRDQHQDIYKAVNDDFGGRQLWRYPLRLRLTDDAGPHLLEFAGTDARISGSAGFVIVLEPSEGATASIIGQVSPRLRSSLSTRSYIYPDVPIDFDLFLPHNKKDLTNAMERDKFIPLLEQKGPVLIHRINLSIDSSTSPEMDDQRAPCCNSLLHATVRDYVFGWGDIERLECVVKDAKVFQCDCGQCVREPEAFVIRQRSRAIGNYVEFMREKDEEALSTFLESEDIAKVRDFGLSIGTNSAPIHGSNRKTDH